ncbi:hypothetical protein [Paeniglutamicibacter sp.]|uniref:hypothetical protein n=1 Tax=Paeniglutamicibacter sp. TaxID=1934391 RepID=UPI00398997A8
MGNPFSEMDSDEAMNQLFLKNAVALGRDMKPASGRRGGSTDMANVSHYFPTIHPMLGIGDGSPQMHSPDFADFAAGPKADRALIDAALAMAYTAADFAADEVQRRRLLARIPLPTSGAGSELDN